MCARRFLMLIFVLTLLAVGGAFALYQWGDQVLVRMATPQGHFEAPAKGSELDYTKAESWIANPEIRVNNPSYWLPGGIGVSPIPKERAATFYLHPTTYLERERWNAPIDAAGETARRTTVFVESQASVFNAISDVWAPKYRQAAYGAFLLRSKDAQKALDLAYQDVLASFDAFMAAQPGNRPIILAGHSQGSLHLLRLLRDRKAVLRGRLLAAYVVGWPVASNADLPATGLAACNGREQVGCVLSWQSFREPANTDLVTKAWVGTPGLTGKPRQRDEMICVNPITGTKDGASSPTESAGALIPNGELSHARVGSTAIGARCDHGFLMVDGNLPNLGPYVLPGNNYHVYDYALFWGAIRADAMRRLMAWRKR